MKFPGTSLTNPLDRSGSIAWGLAGLRVGDTLDDLVARADSSLYRTRCGKRDAPAE